MPITDFMKQTYLGVNSKPSVTLSPEDAAAAKTQYGTESGLREQQRKAAAKSLFQAGENVTNLQNMFNKQAKDMAAATQAGRGAIHQEQAQALAGTLSAGGRNLAGGGGQLGMAQSAARNAGLAESGFLADQAKAQQAFEQQQNAQVSAAKAAQAQSEMDYAKTMQDVGTEQDAANASIAQIQQGLATAKDTYSHAMGNDYAGMEKWLVSQKQIYGGNPAVAKWIDKQIQQVQQAKANINPFQNNEWDAIGNV